MYTTICNYTLVPGAGAKLKQRIQTEYTEYESLISRLPGLVGYYLLQGSADQVISISLFDSRGHADLSRGPLGFCMRQVLGDGMLGLSEIVLGQTKVYSALPLASQPEPAACVLSSKHAWQGECE